MRALLICALVACSASLAFGLGSSTRLANLIQSRIYEDKINATLEGLKETLINGDPENGIPSFAPLVIDELYLNLTEDNLIHTDMTINDAVVTGVPDFTVTHLKVSVVGFAVDFNVIFDHINLQTKYDGSADILGFIPVYGAGDLEIDMTQLEIIGSFKLGTTDGIVSIDNLEVGIHMGEFSFHVTGLLNNEDASALISALLTDVVNDILDNRGAWLTKTFSPIISNLLNSLIGGMTVDDLVCMLTGCDAETTVASF